jgi:hypothetical protein
MRWLTETIGIVLCVQGVGGALSALRDSGRGWFLVRYVVADGAQVPVGIAVAAVGAVILLANARKKRNA